MFFSKIFLPLFTFIGFAYLTSAAPSLFPASIPGTPIVKHTRSELQSRQLSNLLGVLDGLEQDLAPVLANISEYLL